MNAIKRELRLALTMNGGVSLAVWMGGVTREIDSLRCCTSAPTDALASAWKAILDTTEYSRVVVDSIAGTSAGGLNGLLLGSAIANQGPLPDLRTLWVDAASLTAGSLLRTPTNAESSLLDGGLVTRKLTEKLTEILNAATASDPPDPNRSKVPSAPTPPKDFTLLVTATALGSESRVVSPRDSGIRVVDGRRVFKFSRQDQGHAIGNLPTLSACNDFTPDQIGDLVLAGLASSAFPFAFSPVQCTDSLSRREVNERSRQGEFLVDGGVLDNAPFEPLIEAIHGRRVDAPFERVLVYIKPTAESRGRQGTRPAPNLLRTLPGPLLAASREADSRLDGEDLSESLGWMRYTTCDPFHVLSEALRDGSRRGSLLGAATQLLPLYHETRQQARDLWQADSGTSPTPYAPLPNSLSPFGPGPHWGWGISTADRILTWWARIVNARDPIPDSTPALEAISEARGALRAIRDRLDVDPAADALTKVHLGTLMRDRAEVLATLMPAILTDPPKCPHDTPESLPPITWDDVLRLSLAVEVIATCLSWRSDAGIDVSVFSYAEITPDASSLVDLTSVGPSLREPVSAETFDRNWPQRKLYGERWGHFGAFALSSGRDHDWLWGRLDAASALSSLLLGDAVGITDDQKRQLKANLCSAILESHHVDGGGTGTMDANAHVQKVRKNAADVYEMEPGDLFNRFRDGLKGADRRAITELIVALPGANLPPLVGHSDQLVAFLGGQYATRPSLFKQIALLPYRVAGWMAFKLFKRQVTKALTARP